MAKEIDLSRFTKAHKIAYPTALKEIRRGKKRSHWMWYIFPQIRGLGRSEMAQEYAIRSLKEAAAFLEDPVLGGNLREISGALLKLKTEDASEVFGYPDDLKLRSCMTLFSLVSEKNSVFRQVLDKYFHGEPDRRTLELLCML